MPLPEHYIGKVCTFHADNGSEIPMFIGFCEDCKCLFPKGQEIPDFRLKMRVVEGDSKGKAVWVEMIRNWAYECFDIEDAIKRKKETYKRYDKEWEYKDPIKIRNEEYLDNFNKRKRIA